MSTAKEEAIFVHEDELADARAHYEAPESKIIVLAWGDLPSQRHRQTIKRARLQCKKKSELPRGLSQLEKCESLVLPSNLIQGLITEGAIPPTVVHLALTGKRKIAWPGELVLPAVRRLGVGDNTLALPTGALPNIETVGLSLDRKLERLQVLRNIEHLEKISLTNVDSEAPITEIKRLSPRAIDLVDGKIESIDALKSVSDLASVKLARLTRLTSIEPLLALNALKELYIHTCKKIADAPAVLPRLQHLDTLRVIACGRIGLESVDDVLRSSISTYIRSGSR